MSTRPILLDTFCKAGGCSKGYFDAGFQPFGIDIEPQKNYPYDFCQMDALEAMRLLIAGEGITFKSGRVLYLRDIAATHASPPCQGYSDLTPAAHKAHHPRMIGEVRSLLIETRKPYIIENVSGARKHMIEPLKLCGSQFGLDVWRHRYFESTFLHDVMIAPCDHSNIPVLVSGSPRRKGSRKEPTTARIREAMQIDWMIKTELDDAIPPAYTKFIGHQLLEVIAQ